MKKGILIALAAILLAVGAVGIAYASDTEKFEEKIQKIFVTNTEPISIKLDGEVGEGCQIPDVISVKPAPQKWEYKRLDASYVGEGTINALAQEGWELDNYTKIQNQQYEILFFKRPIN